jgi:hypothetical protein
LPVSAPAQEVLGDEAVENQLTGVRAKPEQAGRLCRVEGHPRHFPVHPCDHRFDSIPLRLDTGVIAVMATLSGDLGIHGHYFKGAGKDSTRAPA